MIAEVQPLESPSRRVFLSASFPSERSPSYYETADPDEMTQAIVALGRAVFAAGGGIVFGGHPTVSPLIMMVAEEYLPESLKQRREMIRGGKAAVVIYQSRAFTGSISESTRRMSRMGLGSIVWTPVAKPEAPRAGQTHDPREFPKSLQTMRERMLTREDLLAAVFIGGMEGVRDEASLFREVQPGKPYYSVGAPGGASRELASEELSKAEEVGGVKAEWARDLLVSREYPALMQRITRELFVKNSGWARKG